VEEVASFLGVSPQKIVKTLLYRTEKGVIGALVAGDREINEIKLKRLLSLQTLELVDAYTIEEVTGGPLGFSGPIGLKIPLYADKDILAMEDFVVGANELDVHTADVNVKDFKAEGFYDLKVAAVGDACPRCGGKLTSTKGIEVGHIFKLGTKYSDAMKACFRDQDGKEHAIVMGCYGIGVGRTVAAAIEQNHDENGMILPFAIAPFEVEVLPVNTTHAETMEVAEEFYKTFQGKGIDVLMDDRNERPGVKFNDGDLIGVPLRVTVGERGLKEGMLDIKLRNEKQPIKVKKEDVVGRVLQHVEASRGL